MTLSTISKLCRFLSLGSIVFLIASLLLSSSPMMYLGVLGTFAHALLNMKYLRCPYCGGRLASVRIGSDCPRCGQHLRWE